MANTESSMASHPNDQPGLLTELPFGLPGRVFRCPMPFSPYDPHGHALQVFRRREISVTVVLPEADECRTMTGRDLPALYLQAGLQILHLPIPDGGIPSKDELEDVVTTIIQHAQAGQHVAIHCYAGIGRTGLVAAALAKRLLGVPGEAAIAWVRRYIPRAVETPAQRRLLVEDNPGHQDLIRVV
jgi:protein-tyrosine phosphatase